MPTNNYSELEAPAIASTSSDLLIDIEAIENSSFQQEEDALNEIARYHLDGKKPSLKLELLKQSGLFLISGLGVMFYYQPTRTYAQSICDDAAYKNIPCAFFINSHVAGTLLVAGGILMVATNSFIDQHNASDIPTQLRKYLRDPLSRRQRLVENIITWVGSFVASAPFIIITLVNPIPGLPKFLLYLQAGMVGFTNTLLHLLPFKLAFKNKLYRVPFLPIEFLAGVISNSLLSEEERQAKQLQNEINKNLQMLKQTLIDSFNSTKKRLSINGFRFTGCSYKNELTRTIYNIKESNIPLDQLSQYLDLFCKSPEPSVSSSGISRVFLRNFTYFLGALWVVLACSGFWGGTFNEMTELTGSFVLGGLASFLSIYCLCVLLAFFGGNALQNTSGYLTVCKEDTVKIALAFKLYPKISALLLSISTYLSIFSYAAGAQLINDNFNDKLDALRPYLLRISQTGLIFLGFTAMVDLLKNGLSKTGHHAGSEDTKLVLQLFEALSQMGNSIQLIDSNQLLESLAKMNSERLKIILNINDENSQSIKGNFFQLAEHLKTKLLSNFEAKLIDITDKGQEFLESLNRLQEDKLYSVDKIREFLAYLDDQKIIEEAQAYKNVCEILKTFDSINLMEMRIDVNSNHDEGYAGPSTETTPLISNLTPVSDARANTSPLTRFFFPPSRQTHFQPPMNRNRIRAD